MLPSEQVSIFNEMYPVNTAVIYWPVMTGVNRKGKRVYTSSKAGIIGGTAVVAVREIGNVSLSHVQHGLHGLEKTSKLFDPEFTHQW